MSVAFEGMETVVLTFLSGSTTVGFLGAMSGNNTVKNAGAGVAPVGVILNKRNGHVAVQVRGYTELKYSGTAPGLGWNNLVSDGSGGLRLAATGETGKACLVVNLNTDDKKMGLFL